MKDCIKTEIYMKEKGRMCGTADTCEQCFFREHTNAFTPCEHFEFLDPLKAIEIVQKWSNENPEGIETNKVKVKRVRAKKGT